MSSKYIVHPMEQSFNDWCATSRHFTKHKGDVISQIINAPLVYNEDVKDIKPWESDPVGWEEEHY